MLGTRAVHMRQRAAEGSRSSAAAVCTTSSHGAIAAPTVSSVRSDVGPEMFVHEPLGGGAGRVRRRCGRPAKAPATAQPTTPLTPVTRTLTPRVPGVRVGVAPVARGPRSLQLAEHSDRIELVYVADHRATRHHGIGAMASPLTKWRSAASTSLKPRRARTGVVPEKRTFTSKHTGCPFRVLSCTLRGPSAERRRDPCRFGPDLGKSPASALCVVPSRMSRRSTIVPRTSAASSQTSAGRVLRLGKVLLDHVIGPAQRVVQIAADQRCANSPSERRPCRGFAIRGKVDSWRSRWMPFWSIGRSRGRESRAPAAPASVRCRAYRWRFAAGPAS